jgi:hypothetical protein
VDNEELFYTMFEIGVLLQYDILDRLLYIALEKLKPVELCEFLLECGAKLYNSSTQSFDGCGYIFCNAYRNDSLPLVQFMLVNGVEVKSNGASRRGLQECLGKMRTALWSYLNV